MILILHLVCLLCIFELHLLNYERISEGSENHLKRHGTERVKGVATLLNLFLTVLRQDSQGSSNTYSQCPLRFTKSLLPSSYSLFKGSLYQGLTLPHKEATDKYIMSSRVSRLFQELRNSIRQKVGLLAFKSNVCVHQSIQVIVVLAAARSRAGETFFGISSFSESKHGIIIMVYCWRPQLMCCRKCKQWSDASPSIMECV